MSASVHALAPSLYNTFQWVSPFLIDQIVYRIFTRSTSYETSWIVSSIASGVAIWKLCPKTNQKLIGGIYVAYKAVHLFYIWISKAAPVQLPNLVARQRQYDVLLGQFTINQPCFDSRLFDQALESNQLVERLFAIPEVQKAVNDKAQLWATPTIQIIVKDQIEQAAHDMEKIYQFLQYQAGEGNYQRMANIILTNSKVRPWFNGDNAPLKRFYLLPRQLRVNVILQNGDQTRLMELRHLYNKDPFLIEGTNEFTWRAKYNQVMKKFEPILQYIDDQSIRQFMVQDNPDETY